MSYVFARTPHTVKIGYKAQGIKNVETIAQALKNLLFSLLFL
jgi:hypothetical protein